MFSTQAAPHQHGGFAKPSHVSTSPSETSTQFDEPTGDADLESLSSPLNSFTSFQRAGVHNWPGETSSSSRASLAGIFGEQFRSSHGGASGAQQFHGFFMQSSSCVGNGAGAATSGGAGCQGAAAKSATPNGHDHHAGNQVQDGGMRMNMMNEDINNGGGKKQPLFGPQSILLLHHENARKPLEENDDDDELMRSSSQPGCTPLGMRTPAERGTPLQRYASKEECVEEDDAVMRSPPISRASSKGRDAVMQELSKRDLWKLLTIDVGVVGYHLSSPGGGGPLVARAVVEGDFVKENGGDVSADAGEEGQQEDPFSASSIRGRSLSIVSGPVTAAEIEVFDFSPLPPTPPAARIFFTNGDSAENALLATHRPNLGLATGLENSRPTGATVVLNNQHRFSTTGTAKPTAGPAMSPGTPADEEILLSRQHTVLSTPTTSKEECFGIFPPAMTSAPAPHSREDERQDDPPQGTNHFSTDSDSMFRQHLRTPKRYGGLNKRVASDMDLPRYGGPPTVRTGWGTAAGDDDHQRPPASCAPGEDQTPPLASLAPLPLSTSSSFNRYDLVLNENNNSSLARIRPRSLNDIIAHTKSEHLKTSALAGVMPKRQPGHTPQKAGWKKDGSFVVAQQSCGSSEDGSSVGGQSGSSIANLEDLKSFVEATNDKQGLLAPRGGVGSFGNSRNLRGQFSRQMDAGPDDKSPSSDAQQQVAQKKKRRR